LKKRVFNLFVASLFFCENVVYCEEYVICSSLFYSVACCGAGLQPSSTRNEFKRIPPPPTYTQRQTLKARNFVPENGKREYQFASSECDVSIFQLGGRTTEDFFFRGVAWRTNRLIQSSGKRRLGPAVFFPFYACHARRAIRKNVAARRAIIQAEDRKGRTELMNSLSTS
jgi:hypothetical protein